VNEYPKDLEKLRDLPVLPPWEQIPSLEGGDLARDLHMTTKELRALLRRWSEESMFIWTYANAPGLEQRLNQYLKDRESYYARISSKGQRTCEVAQPAEVVVKKPIAKRRRA
jgi:hypothetical protein